MIVIISHSQDIHALRVSEILTTKYRAKHQILDLSQKLTINASYDKTNNFFELKSGNEENIIFDDVKSIWWRRPKPLKNDQPLSFIDKEFIFGEWFSTLQGVWKSLNCLWINNIHDDQIASFKPYQLKIAKKVGLTIPDTVITNNPDVVDEFFVKHEGNVIFKSLSVTQNAWGETRPLKKEFLNYRESLKLAPVIFQEYVDDPINLRITIIGNEIFAAEGITNEFHFDFRMSKVVWKKHSLPQDVKNALLKLMRELKLEYGAIDMKYHDGHYYFLEINPAGQFLFVENDTNLDISDALAKHLIKSEQTK